RRAHMTVPAAATVGAFEECTMNVTLAEKFFRANPADPESRRGALIACTKMANLLAMRGDRDSAGDPYRRAEGLALEAVAAMPHNTDASRDLSIVYGMHGMF